MGVISLYRCSISTYYVRPVLLWTLAHMLRRYFNSVSTSYIIDAYIRYTLVLPGVDKAWPYQRCVVSTQHQKAATLIFVFVSRLWPVSKIIETNIPGWSGSRNLLWRSTSAWEMGQLIAWPLILIAHLRFWRKTDGFFRLPLHRNVPCGRGISASFAIFRSPATLSA